MFHFCGLEIPVHFNQIIEYYCGYTETGRPYKTRRTSRDMVDKWKKELSVRDIKSIREGYLQSGLKYYADDRDWKLM